MARAWRVHLVGLTKEDPRVTREFDHVYLDGAWLVCSNEEPQEVRYYPERGVISAEKNGEAE